MYITARQGDLIIEKLSRPISGELTKETNFVFAGNASRHPHTLRGTALIQRAGRATRIRIAEPTVLDHGRPDGHETVRLDEAGDYEVRPLRERRAGGDMAVED
jgi:hypothetical protein